MRQKLLTNARGLTDSQPFFETYNPDTGLGQNSRNFSWSAAHYFLLLHPSSETRPLHRDSSHQSGSAGEKPTCVSQAFFRNIGLRTRRFQRWAVWSIEFPKAC